MDDRFSRHFTRTELRVLRGAVEELGRRHGLRDRARHRFVVAVHELAVNAVRHGGGAGRLEIWRVGDVMYGRVADAGPGMPAGVAERITVPPARSLNGRGLWLAGQNTDSMDIDSRPGGTTVTVTARTG
jgi:serine/threonine-protein kinase RsbW